MWVPTRELLPVDESIYKTAINTFQTAIRNITKKEPTQPAASVPEIPESISEVSESQSPEFDPFDPRVIQELMPDVPDRPSGPIALKTSSLIEQSHSIPATTAAKSPLLPVTSIFTDLVIAKRVISKMPDEQFEARTIVEALRLGVVPHGYIEKFSCGREDEIEKTGEWLNSENGCMILSGEYGSGKSHLLEMIAMRALRGNWAVSYIEIDPDENPFNQPKKIYQYIIKNLKYERNNTPYGFRDLIIEIMQLKNNPNWKKLQTHPYLGPFYVHYLPIEGMVAQSKNDDLFLWLEGENISLPGLPQLYSYQTMANIYCNLLSGIGWAIRNIIGLQGLLILIDEGEGIDKTWYSSYQFGKAKTLLRGLILTANNDSEKLQRLYRSRKAKIPFLWEQESCIKTLFSFTPSIVPFVYQIIEDPAVYNSIPIMQMNALGDKEFQMLYEKISALYEKSYQFRSMKNVIMHLPKEKTRGFVKSVVECFDIMRYNPDDYLEILSQFHLARENS